MPDMDEGPYTIGEARALVEKGGVVVSIDRIRRFERWGLLSPARSPGRFRLFSDQDVRNITMIAALQDFGKTIAEIRGLLNLPEGRRKAAVHRLAVEHVQEKKAGLKALGVA